MSAADAKIQEICETVYAGLKELIEDFHRFYIILYDNSKSKMEFPLVIEDDQSITFESRVFQDRFLPDFAIKSRETIEISGAELKKDSSDIEFTYWPENEIPPVSLICSPMLSGDKVLGALVIEKRRGQNGFAGGSKRVLDEIAQQAAVSIHRFELYKKMQAVHDIGVRLTEGIQLGDEEILKLIKEHADRVMDTNNMYIALYEPDPAMPDFFDTDNINSLPEMEIAILFEMFDLDYPMSYLFPNIPSKNNRVYGTVRFGLMYVDGKQKEMPARKAEPGKYGRTEVILATGEPILNRTRVESEGWYKEPGHENFLDKESFAGWLGVPMIVGGKPIGVIATYHIEKEYLYDEDDQQVLMMMASQAATAIENAWLYQKLEERTDQLQKKNEELRKERGELRSSLINAERLLMSTKFAASYIHRVNNLVGTIPLRVNQLRLKLKDDDAVYQKIKPDLDGILDDSRRVSPLINELNQLSERNDFKNRIDILESLKRISRRVRIETPAQITLKEKYPPEALIVEAVGWELADAFWNILKNAAEKLVDVGGGIISISVEEKKSFNQQNFVEITIHDDGPKISDEIKKRIFEPFVSTKENGSGYGLYRSHYVVKELGGEISIENDQKTGVNVTIKLPIDKKS